MCGSVKMAVVRRDASPVARWFCSPRSTSLQEGGNLAGASSGVSRSACHEGVTVANPYDWVGKIAKESWLRRLSGRSVRLAWSIGLRYPGGARTSHGHSTAHRSEG